MLSALTGLFRWLFAAPLRLDGGLLLAGLVFSALAWLLFRRAPVKPAAK
ncbi:MAG: hypothetical protein RRY95_04805 [Oscillospiraceae bacterium]